MTTDRASADRIDPSRPFGVPATIRPVGARRPILLGTLYFAALVPLTYIPKVADNVLSRYMTIEAIVEHGTLAVDRTELFRRSRPVDLVRFGDRHYSDKPPVLAALASPIYAVQVLAGMHFLPPYPDFFLANLAITGLVVGLSSAMTLVWFRQLLQTVPLRPIVADGLTLTFGFGSPLLTYAVTFNNHGVAAGAITGALAFTVLERRGSKAKRDRFLAGLLAGLAAVIDLPAGCLTLAGLGLVQAIRAGSIPRAYALGAAGPLMVHCWLQSRVTGSPLPAELYPEAFVYPGSFWATPAGTYHEIGARHWFAVELLIGPSGWLTVTPALAFGLAGLAMTLTRRGDPLRPVAGVVLGSLVVLVAYYAFAVRRTDFAGQSFGTRHLLAITPAVAWFEAASLGRLRGWWAPTLFVALSAVGGLYAYHGVWEPWSRVEDRARVEPTLRVAQWFAFDPYTRMRRADELARRRMVPPRRPRR